MNRIRAVATDIDGTLTDTSKRIEPGTLAALQNVERKGIPVMLCSGNVLPIAYALHLGIGTSGAVVAENGAVIFHQGQVEVLGDRRRCEAAFEHLCSRMEVEVLFTDRWRVGEIALRMTDVKKVRETLRGFDVRVEATGFAVHLMEPHVSKGAGLERACSMMGISPGDVAVFGDSENDLTMFDVCGKRLAVANAEPEVKARADHVCRGAHGAGVVEGLRYLGVLGDET